MWKFLMWATAIYQNALCYSKTEENAKIYRCTEITQSAAAALLIINSIAY